MSISADAIISVHDLQKTYKNGTQAVKGVSFSVRRGEIFGILGPNGAGKTTTLEMIEGLKPPTSGDAIVDGVSVVDDPGEVKSRIGVQLQASSFYERLSLKELLVLFGKLYGRTIDPVELLGRVALTEKAKVEAKELSGGQKQRLSIASALVNAPVVLFLDEPTTGLDPQARRNLWELIESLRDAGTTIVLTTHYMDEAEVLCDRIAIMDNGSVIALDTPQGLIRSIEQGAVVRFSRKNDDAFDGEPLRDLPSVRDMRVMGRDVELMTNDTQKTLIALIEYDKQHAVDFENLGVRDVNLEDVFLARTGKRLREE